MSRMTVALARAPIPEAVPRAAAHAKSSPTILGIQLLRVVAATAVVVSHVQWDLTKHLSLPAALPVLLGLGNAGVDLFFVISGFVMVYSSESLFGRAGAFCKFLARRIARVVPLYWLGTTVMLAYVLLRGFGPSDASLRLVLTSYLFVPYLRPSGEMGPLYGVGWTLNYEMFFYGLFALALIARRVVAVAGLVVLFAALSLIRTLSGGLQLQLSFWFNPLILEFVFGMLLAVVYSSGFRLPPLSAALLLLAALAGFAIPFAPWLPELPRWIGWGIPSAFAVAALSLSSSPLRLAGIAGLGDASYALYLIHPMVIAVARLAAQHGYIEPVKAPWLYLAGIVITCLTLSLAVYQGIERPMTVYCRRLLAAPTASILPTRASLTIE
jgi:peptidoglycan/LPS O-acetylase OafA/YrhL